MQLTKETKSFNDASASYRVGQSEFYIDVYSSRSFAIRDEESGLSVNGIRYDDGSIGYDMPYWLPQSLRANLRKSLQKVLR